jgi:hypothetical protein
MSIGVTKRGGFGIFEKRRRRGALKNASSQVPREVVFVSMTKTCRSEKKRRGIEEVRRAKDNVRLRVKRALEKAKLSVANLKPGGAMKGERHRLIFLSAQKIWNWSCDLRS